MGIFDVFKKNRPKPDISNVRAGSGDRTERSRRHRVHISKPEAGRRVSTNSRYSWTALPPIPRTSW